MTGGLSFPEEAGSVDPSRAELAGIGVEEVRPVGFLLVVGTLLGLLIYIVSNQTSVQQAFFANRTKTHDGVDASFGF